MNPSGCCRSRTDVARVRHHRQALDGGSRRWSSGPTRAYLRAGNQTERTHLTAGRWKTSGSRCDCCRTARLLRPKKFAKGSGVGAASGPTGLVHRARSSTAGSPSPAEHARGPRLPQGSRGKVRCSSAGELLFVVDVERERTQCGNRDGDHVFNGEVTGGRQFCGQPVTVALASTPVPTLVDRATQKPVPRGDRVSCSRRMPPASTGDQCLDRTAGI